MYKAKLQELCQKRKWGMPKYSSMKCGPDHDPRFGASVTVNSSSFDSLIPCKSSKLAHNHVAMLAFLHFTNSPPPTTTSTLTTSSGTIYLYKYVCICLSLSFVTLLICFCFFFFWENTSLMAVCISKKNIYLYIYICTYRPYLGPDIRYYDRYGLQFKYRLVWIQMNLL